MSLESARDLSLPDHLRVLNDKLGLECTRLRETGIPPATPTAPLGPEVSNLDPPVPKNVVAWSYSEPFRSKASRPGRMMF